MPAEAPGSGDRWLEGRTVVVTAGGTREPIDPVRHVGNRSSGRMGHALAGRAAELGAGVRLITTAAVPPELSAPAGAPAAGRVPAGPAGAAARAGAVDVVEVETAAEMLAAVHAALPGAALLLMASAVADHRPAQVSERKIRRSGEPLTLELVPTVDILASLRDDPERRGVTVVGFAVETEDVVANARRKLRDKGLDWIVANDAAAIGADESSVVVIGAGGTEVEVSRRPKRDVAAAILDVLRHPVLGA